MKNLDEILIRAKKNAGSFFSKINYEKMNRTVLQKISDSRRPTLPSWSFHLRFRAASLLGLCVIMIAVILAYGISGKIRNSSSVSLGEPVSREMIELDNSEKSKWLYYFKFSKPDRVSNNLLAVIWEHGKSGNYELIYSSVFENSNKPCKSSVISFPDDQPPIFIISSLNDDEKYIHYRMLGFKGNKIFTLMEQNYVANGKLEVTEGVLKETRFVPTEDNKAAEIITYFIPYQLNETGDIIAPAEKLIINKGDHVVFVGYENTPIEVINNTLTWEKESSVMDMNENMVLYIADKAGEDYIYINPVSRGEPKKISVEIIDSTKPSD